MKKRVRERDAVAAITIVAVLVAWIALGEDGFVGATIVAVPTIGYVQYARWRDGGRFW